MHRASDHTPSVRGRIAGAGGMQVVKFAYYRRLNLRQKQIYDRSDAAGIVRVPGASELAAPVAELARRLEYDDRPATETAAQHLVETLLRRLHVSPVQVRVLAVRPSNHHHELHGLYEFGGGRKHPVISVWMRTAQRRQVVAFRSFLRTLLHEVVHHLDYQLLRLEDSFHTQGFYKRAESLYRQLAPAAIEVPVERPATPPGATATATRSRKRPPAPAVAAGGLPVPPTVSKRPRPATRVPAEAPPPRKKKTPREDSQPLLPFMN